MLSNKWARRGVAAAAGVCVIGVAAGIAGSGETTQAAQPTPTATVTKQVPGPTKTVTKTKTIKRATTPAACLRALDDADNGFQLAGEGFGYAADGFEHAGNFDAAGLEQDAAKLNALAPDLQKQLDAYRADRDACRAAAGSDAL